MHQNRPDLWIDAFPWPGRQAHKFLRGHLLAVSGPSLAGGAIRLTARAGLRIGAGLVTVLGERDALAEHAGRLDAIMLKEVADDRDLERHLADDRVTACVLGPGLGLDAAAKGLLIAALPSPCPLVLDADALSLLAHGEAAPLRRSGPSVLTPHAGEFGRLCPDLSPDDPESALAAARRWDAIVVLKGAVTIVAEPGGRASRADNGTPFLATAGAGDVLAGLIAGLVAQGMPPFEAASAAVWLHAEAGRRFGPGLISEDLPDLVPPLLRELRGGALE